MSAFFFFFEISFHINLVYWCCTDWVTQDSNNVMCYESSLANIQYTCWVLYITEMEKFKCCVQAKSLNLHRPTVRTPACDCLQLFELDQRIISVLQKAATAKEFNNSWSSPWVAAKEK